MFFSTVNMCKQAGPEEDCPACHSTRNAEYNAKRFAAVIMRIREPRTTALIFSSGGWGVMVVVGAKVP